MLTTISRHLLGALDTAKILVSAAEDEVIEPDEIKLFTVNARSYWYLTKFDRCHAVDI
ncbi:hypothetical protein VCHA29O37_830004 [Vibrio chagasii]|nr:hypothetical protein VCHA29O37_830004 [Vibrio chagasii]